MSLLLNQVFLPFLLIPIAVFGVFFILILILIFILGQSQIHREKVDQSADLYLTQIRGILLKPFPILGKGENSKTLRHKVGSINFAQSFTGVYDQENHLAAVAYCYLSGKQLLKSEPNLSGVLIFRDNYNEVLCSIANGVAEIKLNGQPFAWLSIPQNTIYNAQKKPIAKISQNTVDSRSPFKQKSWQLAAGQNVICNIVTPLSKSNNLADRLVAIINDMFRQAKGYLRLSKTEDQKKFINSALNEIAYPRENTKFKEGLFSPRLSPLSPNAAILCQVTAIIIQTLPN